VIGLACLLPAALVIGGASLIGWASPRAAILLALTFARLSIAGADRRLCCGFAFGELPGTWSRQPRWTFDLQV
jgi:hypothetical protein